MSMLTFSLQTLFATVTIAAVFLGGYCVARHDGGLVKTGKPLDLAIVGEGYFQIELENVDRKLYTRYGHFHLNATGDLVSGSAAEPRRLFPAVSFPQGSTPVIRSDGGVKFYRTGEPGGMIDTGMLQLVTFTNPSGLRQVADDLYEATDESGCPYLNSPGSNSTGLLRPGYLERPLSEVWFSEVKPPHVLILSVLFAGGLLVLRELRAQRRTLARLQALLPRTSP